MTSSHALLLATGISAVSFMLGYRAGVSDACHTIAAHLLRTVMDPRTPPAAARALRVFMQTHLPAPPTDDT